MSTPPTDVQALKIGFSQLRDMCDPRGYALLDALESVALAEAEAREKLAEIAHEAAEAATRWPVPR